MAEERARQLTSKWLEGLEKVGLIFPLVISRYWSIILWGYNIKPQKIFIFTIDFITEIIVWLCSFRWPSEIRILEFNKRTWTRRISCQFRWPKSDFAVPFRFGAGVARKTPEFSACARHCVFYVWCLADVARRRMIRPCVLRRKAGGRCGPGQNRLCNAVMLFSRLSPDPAHSRFFLFSLPITLLAKLLQFPSLQIFALKNIPDPRTACQGNFRFPEDRVLPKPDFRDFGAWRLWNELGHGWGYDPVPALVGRTSSPASLDRSIWFRDRNSGYSVYLFETWGGEQDTSCGSA